MRSPVKDTSALHSTLLVRHSIAAMHCAACREEPATKTPLRGSVELRMRIVSQRSQGQHRIYIPHRLS
jgi:hypothetical protein